MPNTRHKVIIHFSVSGGIVGLGLTGKIDADLLSPEDRSELYKCLDQLRGLPAQYHKTSISCDALSYEIEIRSDVGSQSIECDDVTVPPEAVDLLDFLCRRVLKSD